MSAAGNEKFSSCLGRLLHGRDDFLLPSPIAVSELQRDITYYPETLKSGFKIVQKIRRGPNVSVLHLRSTSEPWTLADVDDGKLVFDNVNTNFIMDYENFLKNYEKQNAFSYDSQHYNFSPAKSSHAYSPSRSLVRAETACSANPHAAARKLISQRSAPILRNGNAIAAQNGNGLCRTDSSPGTIKHQSSSAKSVGYEYGKENRNRVKYRPSDGAGLRLYANYPIISPPPGFEDDICQFNDENLMDSDFHEYIGDDYRPLAAAAAASSSRAAAKYRLQKDNTPAKNIDSYYSTDIYGHRKEELLNRLKNGGGRVEATDRRGAALHNNSNNNRRNQLINYSSSSSPNCNSVGAPRFSRKPPEQYSPSSNNFDRQRRRIAIKSSPDYYGASSYNEDVERGKWRGPASIVPRRSFSTGSAATPRNYYDECDCYRCRVPTAPSSLLSSTEMGYASSSSSSKHCRNRENGPPLYQRSSFPGDQRVRRSASFQVGRSHYGSSPLNGFEYGRGTGTLHWRDHARTRQPLCSAFDDMDEFDELHIGGTAALPANLNTVDCSVYDNDYENGVDEIFYADKNVDEILACTCMPTVDTNGGNAVTVLMGNTAVADGIIKSAATPQPAYKSHRNRFDDERYPANHTEIAEIFNPPDIANVKSSMESCADDDYEYIGDADFIRKQPDILQSAYYGKRASSASTEYVPKNYLFSGHLSVGANQKNVENMRKKSCSLPKSFQRHEELNGDLRLANNATLFDHWKKYGLRGLFLNRKNSEPVSSIMSETAPTTPIKDMPEKKRYGRLMRIGQYSSSPALDDGSMKHINFDCDTKFKRDKFKSNHPATLHASDFRPASQENIVAGDGVFHKFCKSFSLRFLRRPADQDTTDGIQKPHDSSPCSNGGSTCESETSQSSRLGPQAWRSSSERNRKINVPPNHKYRTREAQINTDSRAEDKSTTSKNEAQQRLVRRTLSDLNQYCTTAIKDENVNAIVPTRSKAPVPVIARKFKPCSLRRSASQPLLSHKNSPSIQKKPPACRTACSEDERALFSEDDMMSDSGGSSLTSRKNSLEQGINEDVVIFAEAVWDHVAIESEELPFNAGDVIEVYNVLDREWWWGMCNGKSGWFPSDFVRLRVNQEESLQQRLCESPTKQNTSITSLSNEQVRSKIICELLNTERDFVKILNDVKKAFVVSCQNAKDLFTDEDIYKIFGNWDQITIFQTTFLENLETNFNEQHPHETCVGQIFLKFREHFCIYSDYCNNHPLSIATLQQLYQKEEYKAFFEECRVKNNLIALPLDGFLLTPIQRICKYPLQLAELLKHTDTEHDDHKAVEDALNAMREVAILINERKRRMESLEKLILWQQRVEGWDGNNLIENSSQMIYQNDVTKVFAGMWTTNVTLFLFDHQLVFCKKDILKRGFYVYKGRISLDGCEIIDVPDGKDTLLGINVRNGLRIQNIEKNKWLLFCCRTQREKAEWLNAFHREKELVLTDERNKLQITSMDRQLAYITATMCNSRHAFLKHKNKKLKRSISQSRQFRNPTSPHILGRKVGTWFMFGANRKNHRRFISKNHACTS